MLCKRGDTGPNVEALQRLLVNAGTTKINPSTGLDGIYGSGTTAALVEVVGNTDGLQYGPHEYAALLERRLAQIVAGRNGMTIAEGDARYVREPLTIPIGKLPRHRHAMPDTTLEDGKIIPPDFTGRNIHK